MAENSFHYEPVNLKCAFCGRMIPAKPVRRTIGEEKKLFCSTECVKHHRRYHGEPAKRSR